MSLTRISAAVLVLLLCARSVDATIALVGSERTGHCSLTTCVVPFVAGGAGDTVVAVIGAADSQAASIGITDTSGANTWAAAVSCAQGTNAIDTEIWWTDGIAAGSYNIVIDSPYGNVTYSITEWSGTNNPSLDSTAMGYDRGGTPSPCTGNTNATGLSQSLTTTLNNDLLVFGIGANARINFSALTCPSCTGTPSTLTGLTAQENSPSVGPAYVISTAAGAWQQQYTLSSSAAWSGVGAAFMAVQPAPTPTADVPTPVETPTPTFTPTPAPTPQHAGVGNCTTGGSGTVITLGADVAPSCATPVPTPTPTPVSCICPAGAQCDISYSVGGGLVCATPTATP